MGRKQIGKTVQLHALILTQQEDEDPWKCKICSKMFKDHDAKLLECQRCNEHFCIKCLGKKPAEYDILSNSDTMWFCGLCKERVVKNIVTDKKIVEACIQIREEFEQRIINLEQKMLNICGEQDVRKIVQKEMENRINVRDKREITNLREVGKEEVTKLQPNTRNEDTDQEGNGKQSGQETVTSVIEEINERKSRQNNMVVFGTEEKKSENREEREEQDKDIILTLYKN